MDSLEATRPARQRPPDLARVAADFLEQLLRRMDVDVELTEGERDGVPLLSLRGPDEGLLIGRHGETLQALQSLLSTMLGRRFRDQDAEAVVDIDDYLLRRAEQLRETALALAERAVADGQAVHAKPMSARDRRVLHVTLRDDPRVSTHSAGEDEDRHVVIVPADDA